MANKKFTDLDPAGANPTLVDTDIMAVTLDPGGTPVSRKTSISNLMGKAPVQSVNTRTGAVVLDADDVDDTSTSHKFVTASDITNLGNLSGTNTGDQDLSSYQLQPTEGAFVDGDKTKLDGLNASDYATAAHTHALDDLSDVSVSSPSSQDVVKWTGSQWEAGQVSVDVDTPLNTALRGTVNPHIGAYPNQSFKVTDNPDKSVMVIADADGNLDFLVKTDDANIFLNTPSARKAASFGFSVVEDSTEPDIEVAGTLGGSVETYSVISGDSDKKGANGLPIRQGFNNPDIGANPAPILISGGLIA
jgi:hypothetical protein